MRLGVHVRIAQGLDAALDFAREIECETVQMFSGNPNGWARKTLDLDEARRFSLRAAELGIYPILLHTPYLVNLAAPDDEIWSKSCEALADAVWRAPRLGASIIVTHIGSHKGMGYERGVERICEAVKFALDADGRPYIALELGSGAGNSIGSRLEHIVDIMTCLGDSSKRVGICIDTAHLWGAGYDVATEGGVHTLMEQINRQLGLYKLLAVHLNDTVMGFASHADRHYHIGRGKIGLEGFRAILSYNNYPGSQDLPGIIETPNGSLETDRANLDALRALIR